MMDWSMWVLPIVTALLGRPYTVAVTGDAAPVAACDRAEVPPVGWLAMPRCRLVTTTPQPACGAGLRVSLSARVVNGEARGIWVVESLQPLAAVSTTAGGVTRAWAPPDGQATFLRVVSVRGIPALTWRLEASTQAAPGAAPCVAAVEVRS